MCRERDNTISVARAYRKKNIIKKLINLLKEKQNKIYPDIKNNKIHVCTEIIHA